jgi:predicted ArsR family transcriptional regulator
MSSPGGSPRLLLSEIEAAAQRSRFELLGLAGWFTATDAADALGIRRGSVLQHARALLDQKLVEERDVGSPRKSVFQWRTTGRGRAVRKAIDALLTATAAPPDDARLVGVVAITARDTSLGSAEDIQEVLARRLSATVHELPGWSTEFGTSGG